MLDQSLAVQQHSAMTPWASRNDVRELGNRIKELLPGGQKLQGHEALALAQAALAHNLDPFNGEIWFIPKQGLMAGIKGHRRAGHNQMEREGGGNYWVEFVGPLSIDELSLYKIPARALAFKARLFDSKNITTYTDAVSKLISSGAPWEVVQQMFGNRPYTEGIGYAMPDDTDPNCKDCKGTGKTRNKWGDMVHCPCSEESKMSQVARAQKRAEADALKRRFDLPFTMAVGVNGDKDEVVAGEFTIEPEQDPAEIQAKMQAAISALRGDQGDIDLVQVLTQEKRATPVSASNFNGKEPDAENTKKKPDKALPKLATIRYKPFIVWAQEWTSKHSEYIKNGNPDLNHVMARVALLGFAEVTEQNMPDVKAALDAHVRGKVDLETLLQD